MSRLGDHSNIPVQIPLQHDLGRRAAPSFRNFRHSRAFEEEWEYGGGVGGVCVTEGGVGGYVDAVGGMGGDEVALIQIRM